MESAIIFPPDRPTSDSPLPTDAFLHEALLLAEQEERRRIARELHDDMAQQLVAIQFSLLALGQVERPHEAEALCRSIAESVASIRVQMQTLDQVVPPELLGAGLRAALAIFAEGFERRTGLSTRFRAPHGPLELAPAAEVALYRVAQEALANVARHARARRVDVDLVVQADRLILTINDDGIGICPVLAAGKTVRNRGVGLASMRERVAQLGGTFAIARTSRGTMVSAELPRAA